MERNAYKRNLIDKDNNIIYPVSILKAIYNDTNGKCLEEYINLYGGVISGPIQDIPEFDTIYIIPPSSVAFNPVENITAQADTLYILEYINGQWNLQKILEVDPSGNTPNIKSFQYCPDARIETPLYLEEWDTSSARSVKLTTLIAKCLEFTRDNKESVFNLILNDMRPATEVGDPLDKVFRNQNIYIPEANRLINVTASDAQGTVVYGTMSFDFDLSFSPSEEHDTLDQETLIELKRRIDLSPDRRIHIKFDFTNIDSCDPNIEFNLYVKNTRDTSVEYKISDLTEMLNTEKVDGDDRIYGIELILTYEPYARPTYKYTAIDQPVEIIDATDDQIEDVFSASLVIYNNAIIG